METLPESLKGLFARLSKWYKSVADRHGFVITLTVCVAVIVASAVWARAPSPVTPDSMPASDTPDLVDRLAEVITRPTIPPIQTAAPTPAPKWTRPAAGQVARPFSLSPVYQATSDAWTAHAAVDVAAANGETIVAPTDGRVREFRRDARYGWVLVINLENGSALSVAGLEKPSARVGDVVKRGQAIGVAGGIIPCEALDAAHIHIELLSDGQKRDAAGKWD